MFLKKFPYAKRFKYAKRIRVIPHKTYKAMGLGVYAVDGPADTIQIPKGAQITGYEGRIQRLGKRLRKNEEAYVFEINDGYELVAQEWDASVDVSKVDLSWVGARINNGCGEAANCEAVCLGEGINQYVVFVANRDIYSGEELLWYYNDRYLMEHFTRAATNKDPAHMRVPGTDRVVTCLCPTHELYRSQKELIERRAKRAYNVKTRCGRRTKRKAGRVNKLDEVSSRVDELDKYFERIRERRRKTKKQRVLAADPCSESEELPEAQQPSVPEEKAKADVAIHTEQLDATVVAQQKRPQCFSESHVEVLGTTGVNVLSANAVPEYEGVQLALALSQSDQDPSGKPCSSKRKVSSGSPAAVGDNLGNADQHVQDNGGACNKRPKYMKRANLIRTALFNLERDGTVRFDIVSMSESDIGIPYNDTQRIVRIHSANWADVVAQINDALDHSETKSLCETAAQYFRNIAVVPRCYKSNKCKWANPLDGVWEASELAAETRRLSVKKTRVVQHATD